jgi:hypothetical protein
MGRTINYGMVNNLVVMVVRSKFLKLGFIQFKKIGVQNIEERKLLFKVGFKK